MGDKTYIYRISFLAIGLALGARSDQTCYTYNCDFEEPCQIETGYTGHRNIQWRTRQGETPSINTGPSSDYSGNGSYIYMEVSGSVVKTGDTTWLSLPAAGYIGKVCIEFAYHMRGNHIGRLDLYTKGGSAGQSDVVWSMQGDQGPDWMVENITVLLPSNNSQITFRGVKGLDHVGDIALDSINVTCGRCGKVAAVPTATTVDRESPRDGDDAYMGSRATESPREGDDAFMGSRELNVSIPDTYVVKRSDSVTVTCYLYVDTSWCGNVSFDWFFPSNTKIQEYHHGFTVQTLYLLNPGYFFSVLTVTSTNYWLTGVYSCRISFDDLTTSQRVVIAIYPQGSEGGRI